MKKLICILMAIVLMCSVFVGCDNTKDETPKTTQSPSATESVDKMLPPEYGDTITATDYSKTENWLNIPDTDFEVDVFYLYPTSWSRTENDPYYCEIDNASLRAGAQFIYRGQATLFEPVANVYAPYYRQIDAPWALDIGLAESQKYFEGVPYTDAIAAFEYYIENYNNGKPFILAGHSQGSAVTKSILKYYMKDHPDVYSRMVAAYVIGYSVTEDELSEYPHLKFAQGANDTGVIVSWNIEAPGTVINPLLLDGAISINPLTWKLDEEPASQDLNLGSMIANRQAGTVTPIEKLADATINKERGSVICSSVDIEIYAPGNNGLFPRGVYHMHDYGFYYKNIQENASARIQSFLNVG